MDMREIATKEKREKKETRSKTIIGLVLVALMVLSTAGFAFFSGSKDETKKVEENGIKFTLNENNLWSFKIQDFEFLTQYTLKETENISVPVLASVNSYSGKPLFFSGETSSIVKQEIIRNLQNFVPRAQDACINEDECEGDLPIKNCSESNVIIINESEKIGITEEDNCVFIYAPDDEQARTADAFLFKILGISGA